MSHLFMMRLLYILFLFCFVTQSFGQNRQVLLREADYYFEQADYYAATHFYELAHEKDSGDVNLWNQLAIGYRLTFQYNLSAQFYYQIYQADKALNFPNAQLWEGVMRKHLGDYESAILVLRNYLNVQINPSDFWYRKALMELKGAELALKMNKTETEVRNLSENINSKVSDFAPFALGDSILYFSSLEKGDGTETEQLLGHHSKLLQSEQEQLAEVLRLFNQPDFHVGNISFNPTADVVFFTQCKQVDGEMHCAIYQSELEGELWSTPVQMNVEVNKQGANNTHPQWGFWNEQEGLFISSDRAGGIGGMDIWFIPKNGVAKQLGNGINTEGDEVTPFYHSEEQKLYFSSDFHPGIGGFDIFETTWNSDWSIVKNTGKPLNSSHNDLYYTSRIDLPTHGFLSSNRIGSLYVDKESCCNDIYAFVKIEKCVCEEIDSLAQQMQLNLPISLYFHNDEPNPNSRDTSSRVNYAEAYASFYSKKEQYSRQFGSVLAGNMKSQAENEMKRFFEATVKGGFVQLEEFAEQLLLAMKLEATVEVKLKGFTSPLNDVEYNFNLAQRRISSIENYLMDYNYGVFQQFIENGKFKITELPFGESQVQLGVSDNPNDRRLSVYSIAAARERRIEIQSISVKF
jgi:tetratricopeptide (TPR) repeat protein